MSDQLARLECGCCGASTRGRQWWNRDTGYGICGTCAAWIAARAHYDQEAFTRCYGEKGVHWFPGPPDRIIEREGSDCVRDVSLLPEPGR
jgi:hypothetical protein